MTKKMLSLIAALAAAFALPMTMASAAPPVLQLSGAIFTSDASGVPVNLNHYASKQDVYLNGGPGINAPVDAAGLPEGDYAFQVTDPSGKVLLSSDDVACRVVHVGPDGRFMSVAPSDQTCEHLTGIDGEHGGITVQLYPFDDTPNNGGEYKAWLTPYGALDYDAPGNKHGFVPGNSKTDNFKVRATSVVEIDTRFWSKDGTLLDGKAVRWTDTLGAGNMKYSEWNPAVNAFHEAHVEAAEAGTHKIAVSNQAGCTIERMVKPTGASVKPSNGAASVSVQVKSFSSGEHTYYVDVYCS